MTTLPIITTSQAAELAGVHEETVRRWCMAEKFQCQRMSDNYTWTIHRESFLLFLKAWRAELVKGQRKKRRPNSHYTSASTVLKDRQLFSDYRVGRNRRRLAEIERSAQTAVYLARDGAVIGEIERR